MNKQIQNNLWYSKSTVYLYWPSVIVFFIHGYTGVEFVCAYFNYMHVNNISVKICEIENTDWNVKANKVINIEVLYTRRQSKTIILSSPKCYVYIKRKNGNSIKLNFLLNH